MKWRWRRWLVGILTVIVVSFPRASSADIFGGDDVILSQILVQAIQQVSSLEQIIGTGTDTLNYIQGINDGIRDALNLIPTRNTTLNPGVFSDLQNTEQAISMIQGLYGRVPRTADAPMEQTTDQSVAEAIQTHNDVYKYADSVDQEGERIKDYSHVVSPQGAERLSAESLGVLITMMNQLLRTNAAILKLQGEQLAISNRHQKVESEHFKMEYEGLAKGFEDLKPAYDLPSLGN